MHGIKLDVWDIIPKIIKIPRIPVKFRAKVKALEGALGWRIVDVPFDVKKAFGAAGRVPVKGTVNDFAFRTSLFPRKDGKHFLLLNKKMQKAADAGNIGDAVNVEIDIDKEKRTVAIPPLLKKALSEEEGLLQFFNKLPYSYKKWMSDSVLEPKSEASQRNRAEKIAVHIFECMDAEESWATRRELPPILTQALQHNPKAKKGWELLPPSHRRSHFFGIFSSQNPETRAKRVEKAVKMMVEYAEKKSA
jgi:uncharacterized protein YdeI (YjbR/CyaY-like superfamily)